MRTPVLLNIFLLCLSCFAQKDNPVWKGDWPDPTVWKSDDGYFYSMATGARTILRSSNLADWEDTHIAPFDSETWDKLHEYGWHLWAPDVTTVAGQRLAYVTTYNSAEDASILVLRETSLGRFQFANVITRGRDTKILDTIDPEVVVDKRTGKVWMFFGSIGGVHRIELTPDGMAIKENATYEHVAGLTSEQDGSRQKVFEGSYLYHHGKYWYLFVSAGWYNNESYRLLVGRSKHLDGVFKDANGRPMTEGNATEILHSDKGDRFIGPGHCGEIFQDKKGRSYMFYHCHDKEIENGNPRPMFLQQIRWDKKGWPYFDTDKPILKALW